MHTTRLVTLRGSCTRRTCRRTCCHPRQVARTRCWMHTTSSSTRLKSVLQSTSVQRRLDDSIEEGCFAARQVPAETSGPPLISHPDLSERGSTLAQGKFFGALFSSFFNFSQSHLPGQSALIFACNTAPSVRFVRKKKTLGKFCLQVHQTVSRFQ